MKYQYKARFKPKNTSIEDADSLKIVEFSSDNHMPKDEDINRANLLLQKSIDPYIARNYWDLGDFLIGYSDPPWGSVENLRSDLRDFVGPVSRTRKQTKNECFVSISHNSSRNHREIAQFIKSNYNLKVIEDVQIEKVAGTNTRFYYVWRCKPD